MPDLTRHTTGIANLDLVTGGGLPSGSLVVVAGAAGTGKTILSQQICFANATPEHKAIYYSTFTEPHVKLVRFLKQFDFFDVSALEERVEFVNLEALLLDDDGGKRDGLDLVVTEVVRACFERRPSIVVIDSAKALRDFADEHSVRKVFYDLGGRVAHTDTTMLFLGEYGAEELETTPEFTLADGILHLVNELHEPVDRRTLRVAKMRGSKHLAGQHTLAIGSSGIEIYPRVESLSSGQPKLDGPRVESGITGLDGMLGGGIPTANVSAILGPSGSGKTVAALRFIAHGIEQGERCLYFSFQESEDQLVRKAEKFGWELAAARDSGQLVIHHVPEASLVLDMLGDAVRSGLATAPTQRIAIDSLAELAHASRELERFPAYARTLIGFMRAAGATSLITSEVATLGPLTEPLIGLSYLFHNVILLRYLEIDSELHRAISVLKMRDSDHEKGVRGFDIGAEGVTVGEKLTGLTGVLGWSALREGAIGPEQG